MDPTPELLADLRKKAEAATPGPWSTYPVNVGTAEHPEWIQGVAAGWFGNVLWDPQEMGESDKAYIAAFNPETAKALLGRIEALERELDRLGNDLP